MSDESVPEYCTIESEQWLNGRWHVWCMRNGKGWFCYRVVERGSFTKNLFWPPFPIPDRDEIPVADLGSCITMCDLFNLIESEGGNVDGYAYAND